jgi:hypothetical protein
MLRYSAWFVPSDSNIAPFTHIIEAFSLNDAGDTFNNLASQWRGHFYDIFPLPQ